MVAIFLLGCYYLFTCSMDYEQLMYFFVDRFYMYIVHYEFFMRKTHNKIPHRFNYC